MHAFVLKNILPKLEIVMQELVSGYYSTFPRLFIIF